ncbi:hypothetical protein PRUPE_6G076600 [Prunus persica]|nr:hypothetical protein PRUPE_6G076600 [Prunus persica]
MVVAFSQDQPPSTTDQDQPPPATDERQPPTVVDQHQPPVVADQDQPRPKRHRGRFRNSGSRPIEVQCFYGSVILNINFLTFKTLTPGKKISGSVPASTLQGRIHRGARVVK